MITAIYSAIIISMFFNFYCLSHSSIPLWTCSLVSILVLFCVLVAEHYHYKLNKKIAKLEKDVEIMKGEKE
jgi:hypothetical protein